MEVEREDKARARSQPGSDAQERSPVQQHSGGWFKMDVEPEIGRKFIALYNDGSGAAMFWRHDEGLISQDGDDFNWPLTGYDRWTYLPGDLEFWCETGEEPMTLRLYPPPPSDCAEIDLPHFDGSIPFEKTHDLKVWPAYFGSLALGRKTFELRRNDRDFLAGDTLRLREWNPDQERYTGRVLDRRISYVLSGPAAEEFGLRPGFAILALQVPPPPSDHIGGEG